MQKQERNKYQRGIGRDVGNNREQAHRIREQSRFMSKFVEIKQLLHNREGIT